MTAVPAQTEIRVLGGRISVTLALVRRGGGAGTLSTLWTLAGFGHRRVVVGLAGVELANALLPLAIIAAIGALVGRVAASEPTAGPVAIISLLLLGQQLVGPLRAALGYRVTRTVDGVLRARTAVAANAPAGIGSLEDPATLDQLVLAGMDIDHFWTATPGGAVVAGLSLAGRYVQALGATVLLARVSVPLALGLVAVVLTSRRLSRRWNGQRIQAIRDHLVDGRAARYTSSLAAMPPAAKETRLFGLVDWLVDRHRQQWSAVTGARVTAARRWSCRTAGLTLALAPATCLVFVVVGRAGLHGHVGIRSMTVALQAAMAVLTLMEQRDEVYQLEFGRESYDQLLSLEARLLPLGSGVVPATGSSTPRRSAAGLPRRSIDFEHVTFAYPGGRVVLDGLDLTIPAGSSLGVVGANGAGKTTLVKLLSRLYEPQAGRLLVDGEPLDGIDAAGWRERVAVIFQDFVRYELSAADNIGLGGIGRAGDTAALRAAAAKAGALELVERLPGGWDTPLARQYRGGSDLSGGEWQRIALARALFAIEAGASVLVLDEPTANLDVRAEAELFDRFLDLTRGLTTVLITHRFSTVRHAERICVLEQGRVSELGSHDELLAADGRYAELFGLQAARFARPGGGGG